MWGLKDGGAGRRWDGESRIGEGSGALLHRHSSWQAAARACRCCCPLPPAMGVVGHIRICTSIPPGSLVRPHILLLVRPPRPPPQHLAPTFPHPEFRPYPPALSTSSPPCLVPPLLACKWLPTAPHCASCSCSQSSHTHPQVVAYGTVLGNASALSLAGDYIYGQVGAYMCGPAGAARGGHHPILLGPSLCLRANWGLLSPPKMGPSKVSGPCSKGQQLHR